MSKIITFSRTFPAYHPKKGQPTYFVEKFWESYTQQQSDISKILTPLIPYIKDYKSSNDFNYKKYGVKHHTIRAGKRWKAGDYFSPRVWSGKPYSSPMITIAPDTLIVKTWDFEITEDGVICFGEFFFWNTTMNKLAKNDGLELPDLLSWFKYDRIKLTERGPNKHIPFVGQIICWNESVNY